MLDKLGYNELDFKSNSLCDVARLLRLLVRALSVLVLGVLLKQRKKNFFIHFEHERIYFHFFSYLNKKKTRKKK